METPEQGFDEYDEAGEQDDLDAVEPLTDEELAEGAGTGVEGPTDEELEDRGDV